MPNLYGKPHLTFLQLGSPTMNLAKRLTLALEQSGKSRAELTRYVGVKAPSVTGWFDGSTKSIKGDNLLKAAEFLGVRPEWLASESGPMKATKSGPAIPAIASIVAYDTPDELDPARYVWVDRYDVQLSAGCGNIQWVVHEKDPLSFRLRWFQSKRLKPENCKALYVRGRSMEPKLEDWDTVMIDTTQTDVIDGEIYAVCLEDQFFIKTVERIAGGIKLKSENPDFDSIEVRGEDLDHLRILGKKVWRGG